MKDGSQRLEVVERKRASLKQGVRPIDGRQTAAIAFHEVIPEALAAWYDHIISEANGGVQLEAERLGEPVAVVDIGGRTTDFVVVADQAVRHNSSGSLRCGLLDLKRQVADGIRGRFDLEELSERVAEDAVRNGSVRLFGKNHDVADQLRDARRQLVERLHAENPEGSVVIQASKKSTNKMLVWVMDASRQAGVYNISIADSST